MYSQYCHNLLNVTKRIDNPDVLAFVLSAHLSSFFNDTHRTMSQFLEFLLLQPFINDLLARCFGLQQHLIWDICGYESGNSQTKHFRVVMSCRLVDTFTDSWRNVFPTLSRHKIYTLKMEAIPSSETSVCPTKGYDVTDVNRYVTLCSYCCVFL